MWIFCPQMTLHNIPKNKLLDFMWIFYTLHDIPGLCFFVQNLQIGVNKRSFKHFSLSKKADFRTKMFATGEFVLTNKYPLQCPKIMDE